MFEHLYDKYQNDLYRFCLHLARDPESAGDIFQDTWVKALKNIHRLGPQRDFLKWLFAIAANLQKDRWRWKTRWSLRLQGLAQGQNQFVPTTEQKVQENHDQELLYGCLKSLSDKHRIPITLYYIQGFTQEEISEIMNVPPGTIKSRLHHGKKKLKNMMEVAIHG